MERKDIDKVAIHKDICDKLNATYKAKNADYGDSFARVRREEGREIILARLKDKLYRLETLMHGAERQVQDEKEEDTLIDFVNYGIMELVELVYDREVKRESEAALFTLTRMLACKGCKNADNVCNHEECDDFLDKQGVVMYFVEKIKAGEL